MNADFDSEKVVVVGGSAGMGRQGFARFAAGTAAVAALAASITSCGGIGSDARSTTQTSITTQPPTAAAALPPAPAENLAPVCGGLFTPTVLTPLAPTAIGTK